MGRERDESGRYAVEVSHDDVLGVFGDVELPVLTSVEVADELGCTRQTAYEKLEALAAEGELVRKEAGARAVVYVRLDGHGRLSRFGAWKRALWGSPGDIDLPM